MNTPFIVWLPEAFISRDMARTLTPWNVPVAHLVPGARIPLAWVPLVRDPRLPSSKFIDHRGKLAKVSKPWKEHVRERNRGVSVAPFAPACAGYIYFSCL